MSRILRKPRIKTLSAILLLLGLNAEAAQVLQGKPDDMLSASVARTEPTLIRVEGGRIRRVFGAEGDFIVTPDKDAGTAYLKPAADKQAFSVFVADDAGRTWKLLLSVNDGPSDTIVIKGRKEAAGTTPGRDLARNQAIKRVLVALDSEDESEMDVRTVKEVVPLWQEAMFVLVKVVDGPLRGEKYQLTNTSAKPMLIDERELYRRGVMAISVEQPSLNPGESTAVYVISEAGE
jgi:conjugal transfer pilus assembly protein TraK